MIIIKSSNNNKVDQVITIIMTIIQKKTGRYDTNHHQVRKECRTRDVTSLQLDVSQKGNWRRRSIRDWINAQRFPPFGLARTRSLGSDHSSEGIAGGELHHDWTSGTLVLVLAEASIVGYSRKAWGQLGLAWLTGVMGKTKFRGSVLALPLLLARPVDLRVDHAHVSCQGIVPRECLLLCAQVTPNLLLARVMDRIFMPRKIVGSRKDRVAGLACRRVDALTPVWASL
jgi:hypothetical protein